MIKDTKIIYLPGTWDLFHEGHLNIIKRAKALGGNLIVGVSTDKLVKQYKTVYPIIHYSQRMNIVKACKHVDRVVKQSGLVTINLLRKLKVDILVLGSDWKEIELAGVEWMREHRQVIYLPYTKKISTTSIKKKIIKNSYSLIQAELKREQNEK